MKSKLTVRIAMGSLMGLLLLNGCTRDATGLKPASFSKSGEVFIDNFPSDLIYSAFGGSDVKAFQVDNQVTYEGSSASMRFDVPNANSPKGSYAGGSFYSNSGRNLSGYNALTFYVKASQPATLGVLGFGNDFGQSPHVVTLADLAINSNWQQVIIPIPDPSKLTSEKGLFYYSVAPMNGSGFTFWIDQVMFQNIGTITPPVGIIQNGQNAVVPAVVGNTNAITGFQVSVSLPTGVIETVNVSPQYFTFSSSNSSVANVSASGSVNVLSVGNATVTAKLGSSPAMGSLKINSFASLSTPPAPTQDPANVISLLTSVYTNQPVDYWNGYWQYQNTTSTTTKIGNDMIIQYGNLDFVGAQFTNPTLDVTMTGRFHIDIFVPNPIIQTTELKIQLVDFGADGAFGGGDDASGSITLPNTALATQKWIRVDTLLSAFSGLTTRAHLAQLVLSGKNLSDVWIDNVYFWKGPKVPVVTTPTAPTVAAPVPTQVAADVLSVYSDTYTNVAGTDFNPNWGQNTQVSQVAIAGNNTRYYANFNYQGTQFASSLNISSYGFLHIDYYSTNAQIVNVYLISPGPTEKPYSLAVPTSSGWKSIDIPLSAFAGVDLTNIIQMKFDEGSNTGNAHDDIYLDNIFFHK